MPDADEIVENKNFYEWDYGFDFYAPYVFKNKENNDIIIGWIGLPDVDDEYDSEQSCEESWRHMLSLPRMIHIEEGKLYQYPLVC